MEHGPLENAEQVQSSSPAGKAMLKKAACCGSGALALLALGTFGPSLAPLAAAALSLAAVLACPIGTVFAVRSVVRRPQSLRAPASGAPRASVSKEVVSDEVRGAGTPDGVERAPS